MTSTKLLASKVVPKRHSPAPLRIVVVGAGISGLSAARALVDSLKHATRPSEISILEASGRVGGAIRTFKDDDVLMEAGPESFVTFKPGGIALAQRLGIADRLIGTNLHNRRTYVGWHGKLHALPDGFMMFAPTKFMPLLTTPLFTIGGKLRMALDLVLPKRLSQDDESLADFVKRRLGKEALDRVAEPLIGGIYGTCPEKLSAKSTVGQLVEMEKKFGSVIRGLWHKASNAPSGSTSTNTPLQAGPNYGAFASFDSGLGVLVEALCQSLPPETITINKHVTRICIGKSGHRYDIVCADGSFVAADAVVVALPAPAAASVLNELSPHLSELLGSISYCTSKMVNMVFRRHDLPKAFNGFGFVVPALEGRCIGAVSLSSQKFAKRAPDDLVLVRASVKANISDEAELRRLIARDLEDYLGIKASPIKFLIFEHQYGLPQYQPGHQQLVKQIRQHQEQLLGIFLAGNAYDGLGIPDCVVSGERAAADVIKQINPTNCALNTA